MSINGLGSIKARFVSRSSKHTEAPVKYPAIHSKYMMHDAPSSSKLGAHTFLSTTDHPT